jgi:UDP-2,4-diacetamido-2,4,6-trideoxy-beta-L-altropyranose hydrolase
MDVAFRVDASNRIGTGHAVRCLTLADELRAQGARCLFIHRAHPGHMADAIRARGHQVIKLPTPPGQRQPTADGDYAQWLGVSAEEDAADTIAALKGQRPDWLIVDHYGLDVIWEQALRLEVGNIGVIDDLANRCHDADLLLDQNYSAEGAVRYEGLLPNHARRLCGPGYAMLNPAYAEYRQNLPPRTGEVSRVLVFFGGTDPENLTKMALEALSGSSLRHLLVDIVVGPNNPHRASLEELASQRPGTTLHGPRPHLADLMRTADLGIGAGGATTWERCCLGLPSVIIGCAENQLSASQYLAASGVVRYLGFHANTSLEDLSECVYELINRPDQLALLSRLSLDLVDGLGTARVISFLLAKR